MNNVEIIKIINKMLDDVRYVKLKHKTQVIYDLTKRNNNV